MRTRTTLGRKQLFRFAEPGAQRVLLVGDFTNWEQRAIPMQKGFDGIWVATVILPPGKYCYRFIVDGHFREDLECAERVPNPCGGYHMVRQVS